MSLLSGPIRVDLSEEDLVYSEDPSVRVPVALEHCGWVLAAECDVGADATKMRVRILRPSELRQHKDTPGGVWAGYAFALERAVLRVDRRTKASEIREWLDALMASNGTDEHGGRGGLIAYELLALRILSRSHGKSLDAYHRTARAVFALADGREVEGEEGSDGATKSAG
jgi:hypothetical protein